MQRLSSIIFLLGSAIQLLAQNPHGADLKMDCAACHTSEGWEISQDFWKNNPPSAPIVSSATGLELPNQKKRFNHNRTEFILEGQHTQVNCKQCHQSLIFSEAQAACVSCHTDMHEQTVGMDCARCHSSESWLVDDITQIHYDNGFPLMGSHAISDCNDCHKSASDLRFDRIGNECIDCHLGEYTATTSPNHAGAGFSTNCIECHNVNGFDWSTDNINHDFFPLTRGHDIEDCASCHTTGDFTNTPTDCYSCHQQDYAAAANPNHANQHFPTDCIECHTTDAGWTPAEYLQHDVQYFPIYSGKHKGEWDQCLECHTNPSNYAEFACTTCHESGETGSEHRGVGGYSYNSTACLACHPTGDEDDNFNHNLTNFALTGEHTTAECIECHSAGFAGTPTECAACHTPEFNQTTNPNHNALGISTDCAACHTTEPEWEPATFANHNDYYMLNGAHAAIANDCATCHNGDYMNTPNTCVGCHLEEYNATTDPNHVAQQFSTDCKICHSENAWDPATFDHNLTNFALNGAHATIANDCATCHNGDYSNTPNTCVGCHLGDYNNTSNPNHSSAQFPTDCESCHTENTWEPSTFDHDGQYFPIYSGTHRGEWGQCVECHSTSGNFSLFSCIDCHEHNNKSKVDSDHNGVRNYTYTSIGCLTCHPNGND
jgi:nitrate/TMAO reductase-like tetraheme cytochrome c subunit